MSPLVKELRVMVDVVDLSAIRAFYQDVLEIPEVFAPQAEEGLAMFELGPGRIIEFFEEKKPNPGQDVELSLEIDHVAALWEKIQNRHEIQIVFPLRHNAWGDTSFAIRDPAGCVLVFFTKDLVPSKKG